MSLYDGLILYSFVKASSQLLDLSNNEIELNTKVKKEMTKQLPIDNINDNLTRIGTSKKLVMEYFGPDGKNMYNTKVGIDLKDKDKIRVKLRQELITKNTQVEAKDQWIQEGI